MNSAPQARQVGPGSPSAKRIIRIQLFVVLTGILLMLVKVIAYLITSSNIILTDALESFVNIFAGSFAYYSLRLASKPRDRDHPYGHGKIEFISASIEGTLIAIAGISMIIKGIYNLIQPQTISAIDTGIYLTAMTGIVNLILGRILLHHGKKHNSMTMEADGKHLLSDAYSTGGMIVALLALLLTDLSWIDNAVAIFFGGYISFMGIVILRKSIPGIMDEANNEVLLKIVSLMERNRSEKWIDLHNLRVIQFGSVFHLDCHVTLPWYFTIREAHDEMKNMETLVRSELGDLAEMFIHNDPCNTDSCSICSISGCKVRQRPFEKRMPWNLENAIGEKQHEKRTPA